MPKKTETFDGYPAGRAWGMPIWECSYCKKKYQTKALAKQHERRIHKEEDE